MTFCIDVYCIFLNIFEWFWKRLESFWNLFLVLSHAQSQEPPENPSEWEGWNNKLKVPNSSHISTPKTKIWGRWLLLFSFSPFGALTAFDWDPTTPAHWVFEPAVPIKQHKIKKWSPFEFRGDLVKKRSKFQNQILTSYYPTNIY